jgi:vacuolar-type H+-ATPase subunit D/Vma8
MQLTTAYVSLTETLQAFIITTEQRQAETDQRFNLLLEELRYLNRRINDQ